MTLTPTMFLAHGAPILLDDHAWMAELAAWAGALAASPSSILVVSAHWEASPIQIGATTPAPLYYDFYGFPRKYYETQYLCPPAPELATQVESLFAQSQIASQRNPQRGLDHGAYVPLVAMFPEANVPVLQVSLPRLAATDLIALGRALAPLRKQGVLIMGSGFLTHNMQYAFRPGIPEWAREFDSWCKDRIAAFDLDALADFYLKAPAARIALPTWEHYAPLLVAAAAADTGDAITFPIEGWWMDGAFTKRSVQFG